MGETPTDDSNWIFCNSDGYFRKATKSSLESKLYPYEANLRWGGKNHTASFGPLDASMVPELGACRTMFVNGDAIDVQYSTDGGSTWTNYGATKAQKQALFSSGSTFMLAPNISVGTNYTNYQLRIIINTSAANVYTTLNKFVIFISTTGSSGAWCTIDGRLQTNVNSGTNTWTTFADKVAIGGWSGYNVINTPEFTTYGNTAGSQYGQVRFTFGNTGYSTSYSGLRVYSIYCFGGVGWETPSTMAKTGHLYSFDHDQNAFFPSEVYVNGGANRLAKITEIPTSLPASDVYAWAKASTKPSYDNSEIGLTTITAASGSSLTLTGGKIYRIINLTGSFQFILDVTDIRCEDNVCVSKQYHCIFSTGNTAPTINWPAIDIWYGGSAPVIEANKTYELDILCNATDVVAICVEVA